MTGIEYLYRVGASLVAIGGVAALAYLMMDLVDAARSGPLANRDSESDDRRP